MGQPKSKLIPDAIELRKSYNRLAIILNHNTFKENVGPDRPNSDYDVEILKLVLPEFGFGFLVYNDLEVETIKELRQKLQNNKRIVWARMDSILIIVLSHGSEIRLSAFDGSYDMETFINEFHPNRFKQMRGKTKLFFLPTIRGKYYTNLTNLYNNLVIVYAPSETGRNIPEPAYGTNFIQEFVRVIKIEKQNSMELSYRLWVVNNYLDRCGAQRTLTVSSLSNHYYFEKVHSLRDYSNPTVFMEPSTKHLAIILNHTKFKTNHRCRWHSRCDVDSLITIMPTLGFGFLIFDDLEADSIRELRQNLQDDKYGRIDWAKMESILIIVLSHGTPKKLLAYDRSYSLADFISQFDPDRFPQMTNKTKLFIVPEVRETISDSILDYNDLAVIYTITKTEYSTPKLNYGTHLIQGFVRTIRNSKQNPMEISYLYRYLSDYLKPHDEIVRIKSNLTKLYYFTKVDSTIHYGYTSAYMEPVTTRLAIILNHKMFKTNLPNRIGSDCDVTKLESILPIYGFGSIVYDDLPADQIMQLPEMLQNNNEIDLLQMDSILFIILSHGSFNALQAYDETYNLSEFINQFHPDRFIAMSDAVKLFIVPGFHGNIYTDARYPYDDLLVLYSKTETAHYMPIPDYGTDFIHEFVRILQTAKHNPMDISYLYWNLNKNLDLECARSAVMRNSLKEIYYFEQVPVKDHYYWPSTAEFDPSHKRLAIIVNHNTFKSDTPDRLGTEYDVKKLQSILPLLGFSYIVYDDLPAEDIIKLPEKIKNYKEIDLTKMDTILIILLTHGSFTEVEAYDERYNFWTLIDAFHPDRFTEMNGKTKLFFLPQYNENIQFIDLYKDLIVIYAAIDTAPTPIPEYGTHFIQEFVKTVLEMNRNPIEISYLHFILSNNLDLKGEPSPVMTTKLCKNYYFEKFKMPTDYWPSTAEYNPSTKRLAIIINHHTFIRKPRHSRLSERLGSEYDVGQLISTLPLLGFGYIVFDDLHADQIMNLRQKLQNNKDINLMNMDSILIIILSPGSSTEVEAYDKPYNLITFINQFNPEQLTEMSRATKLFFAPGFHGNICVDSKQRHPYNNLVFICATAETRYEPIPELGTHFIQEFVNTIQDDSFTSVLEIGHMCEIMNKKLMRDGGVGAKLTKNVKKNYFFEKVHSPLSSGCSSDQLKPSDKRLAIILNHNTFRATNIPDRPNSATDVKTLQSFLSEFGFGYIVYDDLPADQIMMLPEKLQNHGGIKLAQMDSLLIIVLSQGSLTEIEAYDGSYNVSAFINQFHPERFSQMKDAIKLFFLPGFDKSIYKDSLYTNLVIVNAINDTPDDSPISDDGTHFIREFVRTAQHINRNPIEMSYLFWNLQNNLKMNDTHSVEMMSNLINDYYFEKVESVPYYGASSAEIRASNKRLAIILNHSTFQLNANTDDRVGTEYDVKKLKSILPLLGFSYMVFDDLPVDEILRLPLKLKSYEDIDLKAMDSLVIFILSHGSSHDVISAYDRPYKLAEFVNGFNSERFTVMQDKAKIFLICACRGGMQTITEPVSPLRNQFGRISIDSTYVTKNQQLHYKNLVLIYSTIPEAVSMRDPNNGTFFIQEFVLTIRNFIQNVEQDKLSISDFYRILANNLSRRVTMLETENISQLSQMVSTLNKQYYFLK